MNILLERQSSETLARLKIFADIYLADGNPNRKPDWGLWSEAVEKAGLTGHDKAILWVLEDVNRLGDLLTLKPE